MASLTRHPAAAPPAAENPARSAVAARPAPVPGQTFDLFPTPVMRFQRAIPAALQSALHTQCRGDMAVGNHRSHLLAHSRLLSPAAVPAWAELDEVLAPCLAAFGAALFGATQAWCVKELWINELQPGGAQALHNHANSIVSGVVYLTPTHASCGTVFVRSLGGPGYVFAHANAQSRPTAYSADKWIGPAAEPGDVLLFPSHLLHEVPTHRGESTRVTLAFNAVPRRLDSWGYTVAFAP